MKIGVASRSWNSQGRIDCIVDEVKFQMFYIWWESLLRIVNILKADFDCQRPTIIHGFLDRRESEAKLMSSKEIGVFLLRFSGSFAGYLVISFTALDKSNRLKVYHCLVEVKEEGFFVDFDGGTRKHDSLDDVILSYKKLRYLYPKLDKNTVFDINKK